MIDEYVAVQDWTALDIDVQVTIAEPGRSPYTAKVESKTADSSVIWIVDNDGYRRAFDHREGVEAVAVSSQE